MRVRLSEYLIAYLTLFSGLVLSAVAVYYSVSGLTAIFAAAVVPILIMGVALEVGKIMATVWLKQNWSYAHWTVKTYLTFAIIFLMFITSMGIFGYLSKAHSDQSLVSGDVLAKVSIYDEKIKTSKENIETNRKALKQLDEAVDQIMARSQDEQGASKAVAVRKNQQRDRTRLSQEIEAEQKNISQLNEEAAPIRAEIRKVDAEVGPIKYIAAFFYGSTDPTILEKAVTWVIILIIVVFDPLALMLLIASQMSFQRFSQLEQVKYEQDDGALTDEQLDQIRDMYARTDDVDEYPTIEEKHPSINDFVPQPTELVVEQSVIEETAEGDSPTGLVVDVVSPETTVTNHTFEGVKVHGGEWVKTGIDFDTTTADNNFIIREPIFRNRVFKKFSDGEYVQNEEQASSNLWAKTTGKNNEG
jgi:hypothetical protein